MPRILYIPLFSSPTNMRTCSTFAWGSIFARELARREDWFLYMLYPKQSDHREEWMTHPRVEIIPVDASLDQYEQLFSIPTEIYERFGEYGGNTPVDVVVSDRLVPISDFKARTEMPGAISRRVYAGNVQFLMRDAHGGSANIEIAQSASISETDLMIYHDIESWTCAMQIARRHLGGKRVLKIEESKYLGGYSFDEELFKRCYSPNKPKPPPFVVNWAYSFAGGYHLEEVFDAFKAVIGTNKVDMRVMVTSSSLNAGAFRGQLDGMSFFLQENWALPRHEFFKKLIESHLFVYWHWRPGWTSAQLEQLAFGLRGIFHWQYKPPFVPDDWPFIFRSEAELPEKIIEAIRRWDDPVVVKAAEAMRVGVLEHHSGQRDSQRLINTFEGMVEKKRDAERLARRNAWVVALLEEILPPYPVIRWKELWSLVRDRSRAHIKVGARSNYKGASIGSDQLRLAMIMSGWKDNCQSAEPVFVRPSGWTQKKKVESESAALPVADAPAELSKEVV